VPIAKRIYDKAVSKMNSKGQRRRASPLGLVIGSSGSGKTFFSLQYLAHQFLTNKNATKVALYLHAGQIPFNLTTAEGVNRVQAAAEVALWIKDNIARRATEEMQSQLTTDTFDKGIKFPLNMHLCVIFDEAGSPETKSWFEDA
jgi:hypothetical protein